MLLECMVQDVHTGHLSRCFFSSPSGGFNWICPGCLDNRMLRRIFSGTLLILTTVPLTMKSLLNSTSSRVPIWLRDLLVVTMPSCVGLIPDSFSQVLGLSI